MDATPPPSGDDFVSRVLAVVETIPPGRVMTYGDVAAALGSRAARAVGQTMAYYGGDVPWWRVVRASGHPAINHEARALEQFRVEGTPLRWSASGSFRVDLTHARFRPDDVDGGDVGAFTTANASASDSTNASASASAHTEPDAGPQ